VGACEKCFAFTELNSAATECAWSAAKVGGASALGAAAVAALWLAFFIVPPGYAPLVCLTIFWTVTGTAAEEEEEVMMVGTLILLATVAALLVGFKRDETLLSTLGLLVAYVLFAMLCGIFNVFVAEPSIKTGLKAGIEAAICTGFGVFVANWIVEEFCAARSARQAAAKNHLDYVHGATGRGPAPRLAVPAALAFPSVHIGKLALPDRPGRFGLVVLPALTFPNHTL
jgi:uncharacterized membrane protein (DUF485 family)